MRRYALSRARVNTRDYRTEYSVELLATRNVRPHVYFNRTPYYILPYTRQTSFIVKGTPSCCFKTGIVV